MARAELASYSHTSTHGLGLVDALRLAGSLGLLPRRVVIYTIEAIEMHPGASISADVDRGLDLLVETVLGWLREPSD